MPVECGLFGKQRYRMHKEYVWGLPGKLGENLQGYGGSGPGGGIYEIPDGGSLTIITGSSYLPDIAFNSGTVNLFPAFNGGTNMCAPSGLKFYPESIQVAVTADWTGGTGGTVSLSIQDTAGTVIASYTQAALHTANGFSISLPVAAAVSGVSDNAVSQLTSVSAAGAGLQVVASNSTAGSARVRVKGYFA